MARTETDPNKVQRQVKNNKETNQEPSLKGTFASVMLLGGFLLLSWLAVFLLYLARG